MSSVKEFNTTLFEMVDDLMAIINPTPMMQTTYTVFKNVFTSAPETETALDGFWDISQQYREMILAKDTEAIANVLKGILPFPGIVDEVWDKLSLENRKVVGDYIYVLYGHAYNLKDNENTTKNKTGKDSIKKEGDVDANMDASMDANMDANMNSLKSMYKMYNNIWKEFLLILSTSNSDSTTNVKEALSKLDEIISTKGEADTLMYNVMLSAMEPILPQMNQEIDIASLCLPPANVQEALQKDITTLTLKETTLFPLNRKMPFSEIIKGILDSADCDRLGMYWHYIKLFTTCVHECPPEVVTMMGQMASFFNQGGCISGDSPFFLREEPAVLTK